jgi:hypothetical protein
LLDPGECLPPSFFSFDGQFGHGGNPCFPAGGWCRRRRKDAPAADLRGNSGNAVDADLDRGTVKVHGGHQPGAQVVATYACDNAQFLLAVQFDQAVSLGAGSGPQGLGRVASVVEGIPIDPDGEGVPCCWLAAFAGLAGQGQVGLGCVGGVLFAAFHQVLGDSLRRNWSISSP